MLDDAVPKYGLAIGKFVFSKIERPLEHFK